MRWSFQIANITGIQIRLHFTFLLFLGWVGFSDGLQSGLPAAVAAVVLVLMVFGCVLLHELGHAWAARYFGIRTPDITLLPIGGVARLERIPERPSEEIVVALAGPLVSAGLALSFGLLSDFTLPPLEAELHDAGQFFSKLFAINTGLLAFNLLPLFPMDGGRVLRALLAFRFSYGRSTQIAARIGQFLAMGLGGVGLWLGAPMLTVIAVFIFFGAGNESAQVALRESSEGLRVEDAMLTSFVLLPSDAELADAADLMLHGAQPAFPVGDAENRFLGLLSREVLLFALNEAGPLGRVLPYARTDLPLLERGVPLSKACQVLQQSGVSVLPVVDAEGGLVGLLSAENLGELLAMSRRSRLQLFSWFKRPRG